MAKRGGGRGGIPAFGVFSILSDPEESFIVNLPPWASKVSTKIPPPFSLVISKNSNRNSKGGRREEKNKIPGTGEEGGEGAERGGGKGKKARRIHFSKRNLLEMLPYR